MITTQKGLSIEFFAAATMGWLSGFPPLSLDHPDGDRAMDQSIEQWRAVVGWEGYYEVSSQGRVRSVDRWITYSTGAVRLYKGVLRKPQPDKDGYLCCCLCKAGTSRTTWVHVLVATAFIGPKPATPGRWEACHNNGVRTDNRPDNLRWDTSKGNSADMVEHGTVMYGEGHGRARLTEEAVLEIYHRKVSIREAAKKYGVACSTVTSIRRGINWTWLTQQ